MDATSESRDENAAPLKREAPAAADASKPQAFLEASGWVADAALGRDDGPWGAFESPQSVYAMLLGAAPGSLLPPPPIATSGLLPSPTASSLLMHQLHAQGEQGADAAADLAGLPFFTALSPHPHHPALLSPLHAAMGFGPAGSVASPSAGAAFSSAPTPIITMADMMADPMLLFTQPSPTASMLKHLLPPFASPHPPSAAASAASAAPMPPSSAAMAPPTAVSPSILMSMPPAPANVKDMTLNELRPHFNKPMAVVAKELGVCITLMKKICRRNGLVRWPHRRIRSLVNRITSLQVIAASAAGAEKKRFQAQIAALREELSAVIQNPNEKSRKAQADARNRFMPGQMIPTTAEVNASMSAMLRDCGGDVMLQDVDNEDDEQMEAAVRPEPLEKAEKIEIVEKIEKMEEQELDQPSKCSMSESKPKKKGKKSKKNKGKKRELDTSSAAIDDDEDDESPRCVSDLADPSPALSPTIRPGKKRKRVGRCFGNTLPPPPIKIPRLDEQSSTRSRCHSAPERRTDKKRVLRSSDRLASGSGHSPSSSHCVRPATTTNRGKRGSISSILCHTEL